ncbi:DUF1127 domain-containing protein [Ancylobacter mangrovi]|uniref:DUF1127 domain-containing protein n=1 Tax=Ancylobacter mangrovi TaxID=2972472 RepID=UPI0021639E6D|nr:DUF1127 domain-containing protein [Ancylobacter mangrovi]MCS0505153.1 DUF1127 domain-containing protein [Ancylobacter mangrovi]
MGIEQIRLAVGAAFARRRVYNEIIDELSARTDRQLADIGLSRGDIPDFAQHAASSATRAIHVEGSNPRLDLVHVA